jgi:hypothetical protein
VDASDPDAQWLDLSTGNFQVVDLANAGVVRQGAGYWGAAFDGRSLYFAPEVALADSGTALNGIALRFDGRGAFGDAASWSTFDLTTLDPRAADYVGVLYDGHDVDFIPYGGGKTGVLARYDPHKGAPDAGAWTALEPGAWRTLDTAASIPSAIAFIGGATDGTALYLSGPGGVTRVDLDGGAVALESTSAFFGDSVHFIGAVYDCAHVTFAPFVRASQTIPGVPAGRYDTREPFGQTASWQAAVPSGLEARNAHFHGGAFDGAWIYFAPWKETADGGDIPFGTVVRVSASGPLDAGSSWEKVNLLAFDARWQTFITAVFDGRYVNLLREDGRFLVRYDTRAPFSLQSSWQGLDVTPLGVGGYYVSMAFDGEWLYLIPNGLGPFARFHARTPAGPLPAGSSAF